MVKSEIKVTVNIKGAVAGFNNLEQVGTKTTNSLSKGANKATMQVKQLNGEIGKSGQNATAGAVGFQTMSMGMLNLSTSAVQTFTSLSNLDRVQNRAAASAVGLERAEDLLARKQSQLTKLVEAGNGAGRDAVLIRKEITTATNDLAVKTEKLKIEQGAVTDVYLLFFANIANVGVSTMMVLSNMMSAEQIARVKSIVTTKLHTLSTWENLKASRVSAATDLTSIGILHSKSAAVVSLTIKTRLLTIATHAYKLALGPIGLAITAIGIGYALMSNSTDEATDATNLLAGANDGLSESFGQSNSAMGAQGKILFDLPDKLRLTAEAVERVNSKYKTGVVDIKAWNEEAAKLDKIRASQGFSPATGNGGDSQASGNGAIHNNTVNDTNNIITQRTSNEQAGFILSGDDGSSTNGTLAVYGGGAYGGNMLYGLSTAPTNREIYGNDGTKEDMRYNSAELRSQRTWEASQKAWQGFMDWIPKIPKSQVYDTNAGDDKFQDPTGRYDPRNLDPNKPGDNLGDMFNNWWSGYGTTDIKKTMIKNKKDVQAFGDALGGPANYKERFFDVVTDMPLGTDLKTIKAEFYKRNKNNKVGLSGNFLGTRIMSPFANNILGTEQLKTAVGMLENPEALFEKGYTIEDISALQGEVTRLTTTTAGAYELIKDDEYIASIGQSGLITPESYTQSKKDEKSAADLQALFDIDEALYQAKLQGWVDNGSDVGSESGLTMKTIKDRLSLAANTVFIKGVGLVDKSSVEKVNNALKIRKQLLSGDLSSLPTDTAFDRLVKQTFNVTSRSNVLGGMNNYGHDVGRIYKKEELEFMAEYDDWGDNRKDAFDKYGLDMGKSADVMSKDDVMRLALTQTVMSSFSGSTGGGTDTLLASIRSRGGINANGQTSATQAYQITGQLNWSGRAAFEARNRKADWMSNSGNNNVIGIAGDIFSGSFRGSAGNRSTLPTPQHWNTYGSIQSSAKTFGADEIATREMASALDAYNADVARGRPGGIQPIIARYYEATNAIAARSNARAAAKIASIGIDFDPNLKQGYWGWSRDRKNRLAYPRRWINTAPTPDQQIRADIQAGPGVSIPSANRLQAISASFANNGNFTNFNNTAITNDAMDSIGLTEQKVFDIRFESTRGDRELENRMRHIEQQAASSSGTSPL